MTLRLQSVAFDCHDPEALAASWGEALGWVRDEVHAGEACFVPRVENRLRLDLRPDVGQGEQTWVVPADPEGDERCVLRAP